MRVVRAAFGNVLGAMREWLDRNERLPTHFETAADDGGIVTIKVRFDDDELTEIFRRHSPGPMASRTERAPARKPASAKIPTDS